MATRKAAPGPKSDRGRSPLVEILLLDSRNTAHTTVQAAACLLEEDGSVWALDAGEQRELLRPQPTGSRFPFHPVGEVPSDSETLWLQLHPADRSESRTLAVYAVRREPDGTPTATRVRRNGVFEIGVNWHNGALQLLRPAGELTSEQVLSQQVDGRWTTVSLGPNEGGALLICDSHRRHPRRLLLTS